MVRMGRARMALVALGSTIGVFSAAQASELEIHAKVKSGQPTLIGRLYSCKTHVPAGDGGSFIEHGSVTLKDVHINQCGNPNEPAREVWYTSAPGFKGDDTVQFPIGKRGLSSIVYKVKVQ